jgi:hypothetical protein
VRHNPGAARPADNPFASRRIDGLRYRFRRGAMNDVTTALPSHGNRGAVVGPHGSGKTTLLEELAGHLSGNMVWVRLNAEIERPALTALDALNHRIGPEHTILIDGAEQLSPWSWWRIHRRIRDAGMIVITSHRPGRLPTLYECTTDLALLEELGRELAPDVAAREDLEALFLRSNGNLRLCFRELYDVYSK